MNSPGPSIPERPSPEEEARIFDRLRAKEAERRLQKRLQKIREKQNTPSKETP